MNDLLIKATNYGGVEEEDGATAQPLTLAEEFFLLLLDRDSGKLPKSVIPLYHGFIGLAIGELLLMGKLTLFKGTNFSHKNKMLVKVIDASKTHNQFLNYILSKISKCKSRSIAGCILHITDGMYQNNIKKVNYAIGRELVEKGILFTKNRKTGFFGTKYSYNFLDHHQKTKIEKVCSSLVSVAFDEHKCDGFSREIILMLTLRQYNYVTTTSLISKFLHANFPINQHETIHKNIKMLDKKYSTTNAMDVPMDKMLYTILLGIRGAYDSEF
ncbi:hypothetical protein CYY_009252 [Polysphondylium violaceum]|uniref:Uncharacterized protein n=1 Tax=Polysphondylium violaceum TaxID=133409 RepID=A0A8J4PKB8_9MYCE|nr:hypothetical protein CYY_009252 [Polysphondylium violaceum]